MTDPHPLHPEPDRVERAMRAALESHADDGDFAPIDPATLQEALGDGRRRTARRPLVWVAAAAVALVVLMIPLGAVVLRGGGNVAATSSDEVADAGTTEASPTPGEAGDSETRPVAFLDVVIDVPDDWGYGFLPGEDWCAGYVRPDSPFIDRNPLSRSAPTTTCRGDVPDDLRQTSLTWRRATAEDADQVTYTGGWAQVTRVVGSAAVVVQVPRDQLELAQQILSSASVVVTSPDGCASRLSNGRPSTGALDDLRSTADAAVCEYDMADVPGPNLVGSYSLYGDDAQHLLDAMRTASPASPPTTACDVPGERLVVRFGGGVREVQIDLSACGTPLLDDGVSYRHPTPSTCGDLLTGPLWVEGEKGSAVCRPVS